MVDLKLNQQVHTCTVKCKKQNFILDIDFVIVKGKNCKPILGIQSSTDFNLIKKVDEIGELSKEQFIEENNELFKGLGCFTGKHVITLKPNACPNIKRNRRIPLILKDRVKESLDKMIKREIIKPVDDNDIPEWVNNIVIVEKPNNT